MKFRLTKFKATLVSGLMFLGLGSMAQTAYFPYPQNKTYLGGIKPTNVTATQMSDAAKASYETWKSNFVTSSGACGFRRVKFDFYSGGLGKTDGSTTVSEGIAYGMLLSAYAADYSLFSDLWNYYKKNVNQNGVMHWKIENCGVVGANGASDAELDVAMALVVASYQWQSDAFLADAKKMIAIIRNTEFEGSILKPGDMFGGSSLVNPSYFSPAYYRVFANLDAGYSTFWTSAAAKGYEIINKADKNQNGFVPDWCDANGNTGVGGAAGYSDGGKYFFFDGVRTPWRSGVDVLWHGTTTAKSGLDYCTRLTNTIISKNGTTTAGTGSKYDLNGNVLQAYHNNTFVSCFAVAGMAASSTNAQTYVNNAWTDNANTNPGYGEYFNYSFKVIGQFIMSGNFYNPTSASCTSANLGANQSLCKSSSITLNSGITGATSYTWSKNGATISGATSATYTATSAGDYQVIVNQNGCVTRSSVVVDQATITADFTYSVQGINVILTNTSVGASDYTWEYSTNGTTFTSLGTTKDISTSFATAGNYSIRLTTKNTTYGCTGTATVTKKVAVGGGKGWVIDDFNEHLVGDAWVSGNMTALPKIKCSATATTAECPNNPCGLLVANVTSAGQYNPFGVTINDTTGTKANLDISTVPYVAVRLRASTALNIGIGVNADVDKTACSTCSTSTTTRKFVQLAANKDTVVYLDFSLAADRKGYYNTANQNVALDFTKVHGIEFYPNEKALTWTGAVTVDWIIVGAKSLTPPKFNLKRDANGYLVYEDPDGDKVYTTVPDWKRTIRACTGTATITANACTATDIQWFKNGALISSGATAQNLAPGKYYVNLINAGGVTRDSVEVVNGVLNADFTYTRTNYDVHFNNASSAGYTSWTWAYGDVANDLAGSTTWEEGYHNYKTKGAGTYTASLTIKDSVCATTKTVSKSIVIACDSLVKVPSFTATVDSVGCEGKVITVAAKVDNNANFYGFYGPTGTTFAQVATTVDTLDRTVTFGAVSGPLTLKVGNDCGQKSKIVNLVITAKPTSDFAAVVAANVATFTAAYASTPAATYAWTFGDTKASTGTGKTTSFTYPDVTATYSASLVVTNTCGTSTKTTKSVQIVNTSLEDLSAASGVKLYPTAVTSELNVEVNGTANIVISDLTGKVTMNKNVSGIDTLDMTGLANGMYLITVTKDAKSYVTRFVKQ
ncbi:MAG: glycosyl hydrolase family 8 [Cytophagales bacterium]